MYLVTAAEMQAMDRQTINAFGLPGRILMENAGCGATQILLRHFADLKGKHIGIIAGSGNNAGDGFVIGRYLSQQGVDVSVYLLTESRRIKGDAAANLALLEPLKVSVMEITDEPAFSRHQSVMADIDLWVDAILGTGLKSEVKGYFKSVIDFINGLNKPVFAVDIPSGLNSDTGQPCGACIQAKVTATFGFAKVGHFIYPGAAHTGILEIIDIGIPPFIAETVAPKQYLITPEIVRSCLSPRPPHAHKGSTGHLLVVAGSPGKTGAAAMTSMSALRSGAGLVTLGIAASLNSVLESQMMEAMTAPLPASPSGILGQTAFDEITNLMSGKKCLAIGPGIGQAAETKRLVHQIIKTTQIPAVVDADGINHLANDVQLLRNVRAPIILTPHPGEMARLLNSNVRAVQQDRITCAREFAVEFNVHVVLKGARTVIAHPDGRVYLNLSGNAGMASGGMGDVLTGVIAGLLAQGLSPESAMHAAVYLHGAAADHLSETIGPYGYLAGDVMNAIPAAIKRIYDH